MRRVSPGRLTSQRTGYGAMQCRVRHGIITAQCHSPVMWHVTNACLPASTTPGGEWHGEWHGEVADRHSLCETLYSDSPRGPHTYMVDSRPSGSQL